MKSGFKKEETSGLRKALSMKLEGDKGDVRAVIATLGVVDKHRDLTEPGAFGEQDVKISAYNHGSWSGYLPVGTGKVFEKDNEAIFEGRLFLETSHGLDHYQTLKALQDAGQPSEWSYGFDLVEWSYKEEKDDWMRILKKVKVFEVSPVLRGAGENTRTLDIKDAGTTFVEQVEGALAANLAMIERAKSLADLRVKEGRSLSAANRERLNKLLVAMKGGAVDLGTLLAETEPKAPEDDLSEKTQEMYLRFMQMQAKFRAMEVIPCKDF